MRILFVIAILIFGPCVLAQTVSESTTSSLHVGNGTGMARQVFNPPDSQIACATSAASAPGKWMCKLNIVTTCAAPAASSVSEISCAPLIGKWFQTTTYAMSAACVQTSAVNPASAPAGACTEPPPPPPPPPVVVPPAEPAVWTFVANERNSFTVLKQTEVRIGVAWTVPPVWKRATLTAGTYLCTLAALNVTDPKPGSGKTCEVGSDAPIVVAPPVDPIPVPTTPPPVPPAASEPTTHADGSAFVPIVDSSKWPKINQNPVGGWSKDMLIPTTEIAPASDIGAFRTGCQIVGYRYDDPIVFPGQPGKSHLHTFFGNTGIDAYSTATSLSTTGNSTCRGGTINRSSYWVPSMIDTRTGAPLAPMFESNFYYKTGYALPPSAITEVPLGLRMIAGDAKGNPSAPSGAAIYACVWDGGNSNWSSSIPTDCPATANSWLIMGIDFPQCWDGVNLDSPDHKSHMTNPVNVKANNTGNCPSTHPVALPQIAYQILYQVKVTGETKYWRLSSDDYDNTKPAGYSGHGDYFMAWKPEIVKVWTKNCDNAQKDCHSHLLGDGRMMVIP